MLLFQNCSKSVSAPDRTLIQPQHALSPCMEPSLVLGCSSLPRKSCKTKSMCSGQLPLQKKLRNTVSLNQVQSIFTACNSDFANMETGGVFQVGQQKSFWTF